MHIFKTKKKKTITSQNGPGNHMCTTFTDTGKQCCKGDNGEVIKIHRLETKMNAKNSSIYQYQVH